MGNSNAPQMNLPYNGDLQQQVTFGNNSYSGLARQLEAKSELRPGEILKTGSEPTDVVRARLANDAYLIVGPNSEVLLLKPTELRLRVGEVALEVPAGDQVQLLGPEPELQQEMSGKYGKFGYQQRAISRQRPVTGNKVYSVLKNQLLEVEETPDWLAKYQARLNRQLDSAKEEAMPRAKASLRGGPAYLPGPAQPNAAPGPK
jgi:hypothetical protein